MQTMAASPWMFTAHFPKDTLQKGSQWFALTRASAHAAVHDRIVEPWFAAFAGSHWRCAFLDTAPLALDGLVAFEREYGQSASAERVLQDRELIIAWLQRREYLPLPFLQGAPAPCCTFGMQCCMCHLALELVLVASAVVPPTRQALRRLCVVCADFVLCMQTT